MSIEGKTIKIEWKQYTIIRCMSGEAAGEPFHILTCARRKQLPDDVSVTIRKLTIRENGIAEDEKTYFQESNLLSVNIEQ